MRVPFSARHRASPVDRVLPVVGYRQWVLAYPRRLRLAFARNTRVVSESATICLREVFRWHDGRRSGWG
jgi:hypothetical protein